MKNIHILKQFFKEIKELQSKNLHINEYRAQSLQLLLKYFDRLLLQGFKVIPVLITIKDDKKQLKFLTKWQKGNYDPEQAKKILQGFRNKNCDWGVLINLPGLVVIDIDNYSRFQEKIGEIQEFIEETKPDVVISTKRGYHCYYFIDGIKADKTLLEEYGFEVRSGHELLVLIPPTCYAAESGYIHYKIIFLTEQDEQERVENEKKELKDFLKEVRKELSIKHDIAIKEKEFARERAEFQDLKEIISEIKRKVRFIDIIPQHFAKTGSNYQLFHCPLHPPDKNPSFSVYQTGNGGNGEIGICFHEYSPGEKKGIYDVIALYQCLKKKKFLHALLDLAKLAGLEENQIKKIQKYLKLKKNQQKEIRKEIRKVTTIDTTWSAEYLEEKDPVLAEYIELGENYRESEIAFYSAPHQVSDFSRKRFAMIFDYNETWEVLETVKKSRSEFEYVIDKNTSLEFLKEVCIEIEQMRSGQVVKIDRLFDYLVIQKKKKIFNFVIQEGVEFQDPVRRRVRFDLTLRTNKNGGLIHVSNTSIEGLVNLLKEQALVADTYHAKNALSVLISNLIQAGKIEQKKECSSPSIVLIDNKLTLSKIQPRKIEKEELRKSLEFLNYVVENFYNYAKAEFVTALKWFIISPFSFVSKQQHSYIPALFNYGPGGTGKSAAARLLQNLYIDFYHDEQKEEISGDGIGTAARLGELLSYSSFPVLVNEPGKIFWDEEISEVFKASITQLICRQAFRNGILEKFPAFANLYLSSNDYLPKTTYWLRRFCLVFWENFPEPGKEDEFRKALDKAKKFLPTIGHYILYNVFNFEELILELKYSNWIEIAESILQKLYKDAGLEIPAWLELKTNVTYDHEKLNEEQKALVFSFLRRELVKEARNFKDKDITIFGAMRILFNANVLPWLKKDSKNVYLLRPVLDVLKRYNIKISCLRGLASILNYKYKDRVTVRLKKDRFCFSAVVIPISEFEEKVLLQYIEDDKEDKSPDNKKHGKDTGLVVPEGPAPVLEIPSDINLDEEIPPLPF